jgi:hypothetical protein
MEAFIEQYDVQVSKMQPIVEDMLHQMKRGLDGKKVCFTK